MVRLESIVTGMRLAGVMADLGAEVVAQRGRSGLARRDTEQ